MHGEFYPRRVLRSTKKDDENYKSVILGESTCQSQQQLFSSSLDASESLIHTRFLFIEINTQRVQSLRNKYFELKLIGNERKNNLNLPP